MCIARVFGAAMISTMLVAGVPVQADPLRSKQPMASETIRPTAKGAKPFTAKVSGQCDVSSCAHNFGKKGNKARNIDIVTCGMITDNATGLYGFVYIDGESTYILPISSSQSSQTVTYSMIEFQYKFTVPAGEEVSVIVYSSGMPQSAFCSIGGTME